MIGLKIQRVKDGFQLEHNETVLASYEDIQKAHEMRLFYAGIKPMVSQNFDKNRLPNHILERFPYVVRTLKGTDQFVSLLLFQNEEVKSAYLDTKSTLKGDAYFTKLGEFFGYPPIAISDFLERRVELAGTISPWVWKCISYHGIQFICKEENVDKCLVWLDQAYSIPKEYQAGVFIRDAFKSMLKSA